MNFTSDYIKISRCFYMRQCDERTSGPQAHDPDRKKTFHICDSTHASDQLTCQLSKCRRPMEHNFKKPQRSSDKAVHKIHAIKGQYQQEKKNYCSENRSLPLKFLRRNLISAKGNGSKMQQKNKKKKKKGKRLRNLNMIRALVLSTIRD